MKKIFTIALLFAAGVANAYGYGNISDRKGSLHLPVDKKMTTNVNWEAASNMKPEVPAIKITGKANAPVHVVYGGIVKSIMSVGGRQIVLVQHDKYFTIYDGVEDVKVKKDEVLTEGQLIGVVNKTDNTLAFQMWMDDNGKPTTLTVADWMEK